MLKAGMWIAQGPETNVLLLLSGVEPLLVQLILITLNRMVKLKILLKTVLK